MALPLFCSLLAAAVAGVLIAYVPTARQHNWPVGKLFELGTVPAAVYLGVSALLLGETIGWAWAGKAIWWGLLWIVLAAFVGAPLIASLLKRDIRIPWLMPSSIAALRKGSCRAARQTHIDPSQTLTHQPANRYRQSMMLTGT